jgi:uncharacterized protein YidB (DUF937 family)
MDISSMLSSLGADAGAVDKDQVTNATQQLVNDEGGINGLLDKLKGAGLGDQVDSWVSTGDNRPVDPDQLKGAIGDDELNALSASSGLSIQQLLPMLAAFLPTVIDQLTPGGQRPEEGGAGSLDSIGDMIGGMLGGGGRQG